MQAELRARDPGLHCSGVCSWRALLVGTYLSEPRLRAKPLARHHARQPEVCVLSTVLMIINLYRINFELTSYSLTFGCDNTMINCFACQYSWHNWSFKDECCSF